MSKILKVGVIGTGSIATQGHIPGFKNIPDVDVVAVCDSNATRADEVAQKYNISGVYDRIEDIVCLPYIDAVSLALPNYLHASSAICALNHGKHVFCEKPLATSLEDGEEMIKAAERNQKILAMNMSFRYAAELAVLKEAVQNGSFGNIKYIYISLIRRNGIPGLGSWFTNKKYAGGGVLMDIGAHMIDIALWLLDFPAVHSVWCRNLSDHGSKGLGAGNWGADRVKAGTFDVEDFSFVQILLKSGCLINVEVSWAIHGKDEERLRIIGDKGGGDIQPEIYGFSVPLRIYRYKDDEPVESQPDLPPYLIKNGKNIYAKYAEAVHSSTETTDEGGQTALWNSSIAGFINSIRNNTCETATGMDALIVLKLIQAAYQSASEEKTIYL